MTNNFLENYNRYIKFKLGEKRIVNLINFLHFIKEESDRAINKLINNNNSNLIIYSDEINNTNLDLYKIIKNDKESSYLKNYNIFIDKKKLLIIKIFIMN